MKELDGEHMKWLDPWWSTEDQNDSFQETFRKQLERELSPEHGLYSIPVKLIARGSGDDALFQLLDDSNRVALVHLTWSQKQQQPPWPATTIFASLEQWSEAVMLPEHQQWLED